MCFKLDNGSEFFSVQDMQRLKKPASGRMGSRNWVGVEAPRSDAKEDEHAEHGCGCGGTCGCNGKCVICKCAELRARIAERGEVSCSHPEE